MFTDSLAFSGFTVTDIVEAKDFYVDLLGCQTDENEMGLMLRFPNGHRVFLYEKPDHRAAEFTVLNFPVDYIDAVVDRLIENNFDMERYDNLPAPQDDKGILRGKAVGMGPDIAWFRDPFGNILSVLEA